MWRMYLLPPVDTHQNLQNGCQQFGESPSGSSRAPVRGMLRHRTLGSTELSLHEMDIDNSTSMTQDAKSEDFYTFLNPFTLLLFSFPAAT